MADTTNTPVTSNSIEVQEDIQQQYVIKDRQILADTNASKNANILITNDHLSNRLYFNMFYTFDDRTLIDKEIGVVWLNANNEKGMSVCEDVQLENDRLTFSWNVPQEATYKEGNLNFAVRITAPNYAWNSLAASVAVKKGLITAAYNNLQQAQLQPGWVDYIENKYQMGFTKMTQEEFDSLAEKDPNTVYLVETSDGAVFQYVGDKLISSGGGAGSSSADISKLTNDVTTLNTTVTNLNTTVTSHTDTLSVHDTDITDLKTSVTDITSDISDINTKLDNIPEGSADNPNVLCATYTDYPDVLRSYTWETLDISASSYAVLKLTGDTLEVLHDNISAAELEAITFNATDIIYIIDKTPIAFKLGYLTSLTWLAGYNITDCSINVISSYIYANDNTALDISAVTKDDIRTAGDGIVNMGGAGSGNSAGSTFNSSVPQTGIGDGMINEYDYQYIYSGCRIKSNSTSGTYSLKRSGLTFSTPDGNPPVISRWPRTTELMCNDDPYRINLINATLPNNIESALKANEYDDTALKEDLLKSTYHIYNPFFLRLSQNINNFKLANAEWHNKNLLYVGIKDTTVSGVTFTETDNGKVTVNGTATAEINFVIGEINYHSLPAGSYVLAGCPATGSSTTYYLQQSATNMISTIPDIIDDGQGEMRETSKGTIRCVGKLYTTTYDKPRYRRCVSIRIKPNTVMDNVVFYPMLFAFNPALSSSTTAPAITEWTETNMNTMSEWRRPTITPITTHLELLEKRVTELETRLAELSK